MGLDDLVGGSNRTSDPENDGERKYVRITKDDFEEFLRELPWDFKVADDAPANEYVYAYLDLVEDDERPILLIYSTIDKDTDVARDEGADAIRCVIADRDSLKPISGQKKTLRIETWRNNLRPKIENLITNASDLTRQCPGCLKGYLVTKEGQYGEFLGCSRYPQCECMVSVTKNGNYKAREFKGDDWEYADTEAEAIRALMPPRGV